MLYLVNPTVLDNYWANIQNEFCTAIVRSSSTILYPTADRRLEGRAVQYVIIESLFSSLLSDLTFSFRNLYRPAFHLGATALSPQTPGRMIFLLLSMVMALMATTQFCLHIATTSLALQSVLFSPIKILRTCVLVLNLVSSPTVFSLTFQGS
jgi:hypothetical protein